MASDIVERAREQARTGYMPASTRKLIQDQADEIEALRKLSDGLRRYIYDRTPERREKVVQQYLERQALSKGTSDG